MKKSNTALAVISIICILLSIAYGFQIPNAITIPRNLVKSNWLEAHGPEHFDTVSVRYTHLVCNFPVTSLDARLENQFIVRGSINGIPFASARTKNDTLYLDYVTADYNYTVADSKVNGRYPIHLIVGAKSLKSITVLDHGKILIDALPIGSKKNDTVYDSLDHVKNFQEIDKIDITLKNSAQLHMFMHANRVNLSTIKFKGGLSIEGHIKTLDFKYPEGNFWGSPINVDSAYIRYNPTIQNNNAGSLSLNCSKYLFAELHADLDIKYVGNPIIDKVETDFGRVINNNKKPEEPKTPVESAINEAIESPNNPELFIDEIDMDQKRDSVLLLRNSPDQLIKIPT